MELFLHSVACLGSEGAADSGVVDFSCTAEVRGQKLAGAIVAEKCNDNGTKIVYDIILQVRRESSLGGGGCATLVVAIIAVVLADVVVVVVVTMVVVVVVAMAAEQR